jgi:2-oxoglutarate dehydrogenase E1 component
MLSKHAQRTLLGAGRSSLASKATTTSTTASSTLKNAATRAFATAAPPSPNDAFANGTNAYYTEEMYRLWRTDPASVHPSWNVYFSGMVDKGLPSEKAFSPPPTLGGGVGVDSGTGLGPSLHSAGGRDLDDHMKVCYSC